mmetsp:Transcript_63536/g.74406  ORF Transcript_63536/g.74406 Transcript_63536/m.74406 type:complete len:80 (+) Transcript_63536:72-311(+)|eukprot:CAMPEP_0194371618 /NCGR_PEP_ID=MMETSP0174-20130528/20043_1 /TAXON_ID=216777 /ORGANISM="Proboscia alata, Strain PI-D3" /LENGTH=79 /DNA_ID=CAMNT_0039149791 /DNA_START=68 /DNA_END=307 /DNA_ORIENTATION=+
MDGIFGKMNSMKVAARNYYHPMLKAGSVKPLWHMMIFTSVVMYTSNYMAFKGRAVQAGRVEQKAALRDYRAIHGDPTAH